jgi:hypothetical protein
MDLDMKRVHARGQNLEILTRLNQRGTDVLNEGQANALKAKIENAIAKAASGQYNAAINQMSAFITQLNDMIANGTLTAEQAAPFLEQAEFLIAIWTAML